MTNIFYTKHNKGAALLMFVMLFMFISTAVSFSVSRNVYSSLKAYRLTEQTKQAYFSGESLAEDVSYRYINSLNADAVETANLFGVDVTATTTVDGVTGVWSVDASGDNFDVSRAARLVLAVGAGTSFNFGLQAGNGGILMENTSSVVGDVFSNGIIEGKNSNLIYGDIISAGSSGYIKGVHATGSAWAHTIEDSHIGENLYVSSAGDDISNIVDPGGTRNYPEPDKATSTMPISDDIVEAWKMEAAAGTVYASTSPECSGGEWEIDSDTTIGPAKIECNFVIDKNNTDVYFQGPIWVTGNFTTKSGPNLHVDSSLPGKSIQIIADNPDDPSGGGIITLENSVSFNGFGDASYFLVISMNDDAESGGSTDAIISKNSAAGDLVLYAPHGKVLVENSTSLKELTAFQVHLQNSSSITYESGLANMIFTSSSGGFTISDWIEI